MDEREWLGATDPWPMLTFLKESGRRSERKDRLFAAACCRLVWHRLPDPRSHRAVETTERFIEGEATAAELEAVSREAEAAREDAGEQRRWDAGACAAWAAALAPRWDNSDSRWPSVQSVANQAALALAQDASLAGQNRKRRKRNWLHGHAEANGVQCCFLRDIFGNPFRPLPPLDPAVLVASDGLVVKLARAAYEQRSLPSGWLDSGRPGVLGDALEEAGCTDADLLGHLRGPGPHVRGCFAIDLLLDKG